MDRIEMIVEYIISSLFSEKDEFDIEFVIKRLLNKGFDLNEISAALVWAGTHDEYEKQLYAHADHSFRFITLKEKNYFEADALKKLVELYAKREITPIQLETIMEIVENREEEARVDKDELIYIIEHVFFREKNNLIHNDAQFAEIHKKMTH